MPLPECSLQTELSLIECPEILCSRCNGKGALCARGPGRITARFWDANPSGSAVSGWDAPSHAEGEADLLAGMRPYGRSADGAPWPMPARENCSPVLVKAQAEFLWYGKRGRHCVAGIIQATGLENKQQAAVCPC